MSETPLEHWFLAKAESHYDDWQGNMKMNERRAFVEVIPAHPDEGISALRIWNDFNKGKTALIVNEIDKSGIVKFAEDKITFKKEDVSRLKKLVKL